jgi:1,4-dihydroxy-2-naphthoate octaprenyltransferase
MQTNNTCDIERDTLAGRRTMPVCIGRERSRVLNAALTWCAFAWCAALLIWLGLYAGLIVVAAGVVVCIPKAGRLLRGPYDLEHRRMMMGTVVSYNRWLAGVCAVALLFGGAVNALLQ